MTSFVTEVLASTGKLGKEDLTAKIMELSDHVSCVKVQVQETLESRYIRFFPILSETLELSSKVSDVSEEVKILTNRIENEISNRLQISTQEIHELTQQLSDVMLMSKVIQKLMTLHDLMSSISEYLDKKKYLEAATSLEEINALLINNEYIDKEQIKIYQALKTESVVQREKLTYDLGQKYNEYFVWKLEDLNSECNSVKLVLQFSSSDSHSQISNLLLAMQLMNYLDQKIKLFSLNFINHVCKPIMCSEVFVQVSCKPSNRFAELKVVKNSKKPKPSEVFHNLTIIFDFLGKHFASIVLNNSADESLTLMGKLGEWSSESICDMLIKECLSEAIPSQKDDLKSYNEIIELTTEFQKKLLQYGFFKSHQATILDYAQNVDILFANKMCQDILDKARKLLLTDLHDTVLIRPDSFPNEEIRIKLSNSSRKRPVSMESSNYASAECLSNNLFTFPLCAISQSVEKLINMVYETLNEAASASSLCATRLFFTARNIIELFCDVVPVYHKDNLIRLPQLSAIHHNNCMYVAHHLMMLGHQFQNEVSSLMKDNFMTFVDLIPKVRSLGTETLLNQMLAQKQILMLHNIEGYQSLINSEDMSSLERHIKQSLHQLAFLQRLWMPILPAKVYCQSIGTLVNSLIDELMCYIINQEDIPSEFTMQLIPVFNSVINKAPLLFKMENEQVSADVHQHVAKWMKFKELLLILGANLKDILDRWTEGKGPLANEFTATSKR